MAAPSGPGHQSLVDRIDPQRIGVHRHHRKVRLMAAHDAGLQTGWCGLVPRVQALHELGAALARASRPAPADGRRSNR